MFRRSPLQTVVGLLFFVLLPGAVAASGDELTATSPPVKVTDVWRQGFEGLTDSPERNRAGLNDVIFVRVQGLQSLLDRSECKNLPPTACRRQPIVLFFDGRPIKDMVPESVNGSGETLRFHLQRTPNSVESWADLLGFGLSEGWYSTRPVTLSVGLENEDAVPTDINGARAFNLIRVRQIRLFVWSILVAIAFVTFLVLIRSSDVLRDPDPVLKIGERRPYSLSRCQAAWWFFLSLISFVFIWLVTGQYDLSPSVLVLLGIGFGTLVGGAMVDQNKRPDSNDGELSDPALQDLLRRKSELERQIVSGKPKRTPLRSWKRQQLDARGFYDYKIRAYDKLIDEIRARFPTAISPGSSTFLKDILTDANGVSFHRFQMLVWTVVLGIMFVTAVTSRLSMPQFSATLLSLMGISAGTFIAFKIPEQQNSVPGSEPVDTSSSVDTPGADSAPLEANALDAALNTDAPFDACFIDPDYARP